jgi:hypothetical protein
VSEVGVSQETGQGLEMVGEPEVVVGLIGDELPFGLVQQQAVAMAFAEALSLRKIEVANAPVAAGQFAGKLPRASRRTVAHDEELEIADAL